MTTESDTAPTPTPPSARNTSIDVLRGIAVLGILVLNIQVFSMPSVESYNPTAIGEFAGAEYAVWLFTYVFFEGSFLTLFTVLFGVSIMLFMQSKGEDALRFHYQRSVVLILIGLAHAYLLWDGDVLVFFGLCALLVVRFRHASARRLLALGFALLALRYLVPFALSGHYTPEIWTPAAETIRAEIAAFQGSWSDQMPHRIENASYAHTTGLILSHVWNTTGLMFIGMALYKLRLLPNDRPRDFYRRAGIGCALAGLAVTAGGIWHITTMGWAAEAGRPFEALIHVGGVLLAGSYLCGTVVYVSRDASSRITTALAAVGRTTLSNYLFQTLVATTLFYGHGFGWFGEVTRPEQLCIVVGIWAVQIPLTLLWLRRYKLGPAEWVWRSATYMKRVPLRRTDG